jgi:creatinine amidohydrolase
MQWEQLTAPDFAQAVRDTGGVCVLSVGSLEKHFDHLPTGTDYLNAHRLCCLAAEREPAVVFPPYYFAQVHESRPFPGCIALPAAMTLEVLQTLCDEIARNGFKKILIYNGHGGNWAMLNYLIQVHLEARRDYGIYLLRHLYPPTPNWAKKWDETLETDVHEHACECETSITLANFPELVKMDVLKGRKADPNPRLDHLRPGDLSANWYGRFPDHYAGDATAASAEKGEKLLTLQVEALAHYIGKVKADTALPGVLDEFYNRCDKLRETGDE